MHTDGRTDEERGLGGRKGREVAVGGVCRRSFDSLRSLRMTVLLRMRDPTIGALPPQRAKAARRGPRSLRRSWGTRLIEAFAALVE
jgi:hypothetical protein